LETTRTLGVMKERNDPEGLVAEATYGWYWAVDASQAAGANVHLVAPSKLTAFEGRRVQNDQRDCPVLGTCCGRGCCPKHGSPSPRPANGAIIRRFGVAVTRCLGEGARPAGRLADLAVRPAPRGDPDSTAPIEMRLSLSVRRHACDRESTR
jgi:hypothetical protein